MTFTSHLRPAVTSLDPASDSGHRRHRVIIAAVGSVVVVIAVVWVIAFSSVFGVRSVDVNGVGSVTPVQIRAAADISPGSPLVRLDTAAIVRRVESLPAIATAQVSTSFPSTVTITVTERTPVGYTVTGSRVMLIDRTGVQYTTVSTAPAGLPHFVVPSGATARTIGAALATVAAALPAKVRAQVLTIEALNRSSITLSLRSGGTVLWGDSSDSTEKEQILRVLLAKHPSLINVSDPGQPFTR